MSNPELLNLEIPVVIIAGHQHRHAGCDIVARLQPDVLSRRAIMWQRELGRPGEDPPRRPRRDCSPGERAANISGRP